MINSIIMRFWIFFIFFLGCSLGVVKTAPLLSLANYYLPKEFAKREVTFVGNRLVSEVELRSFVPSQGNFSWFFFPEQIEKEIESQPLVEKAKISPCDTWSFNCYQVKIVEYQPGYLYKTLTHWWLVAKKGEFLLPVSNENVTKYFINLPRLEDLVIGTKNSEFLTTRLRYLVQLDYLLQQKGFLAESLQLHANNDLKLGLRGQSGEILLSSFDMEADKFFLDIQNLKSFLKTSPVPASTNWTLDFRPKHPVLKVSPPLVS